MSLEHRRPVGHWLLDALPNEDYERLAADLLPVSLVLGEVIYESGRRKDAFYFPTTSHVSLLYTTSDGATAELGLVGKEGVVGVSLFVGGDTTPNRAVVLGAGSALKLPAKVMLEEFNRRSEFQHLLLRYTQALITQMSQTAVCNRLHPVEQRLCRWLLMTRDRIQSDKLHVTHEFISNILGVRWEGVSDAANALQKNGFIRYVRGHIEIRDQEGLENSACECYAIVKAEHRRWLSVEDREIAPTNIEMDFTIH